MDALTEAAVHAAGVVAPGVLNGAAATIAAYEEPGFALRRRLGDDLPATAIEALQPLLDAWSADGADGAVVASALRAAAATADRMRTEQQVEVVWTGPKTDAVHARTTREALLEVIQAADHRLTLFSYAGHHVPDVVTAVLARVDRGVHVRMVLETAKDSQGGLSVDAASAFGDLAGKCDFYVWPLERRQLHSDKSASMHVKAALADDHTVLVTSANLTGAALLRNMELGLLVKRGPVPAALAVHIDELIGQQELRRV
jgi:cardiolipin synthase A/B